MRSLFPILLLTLAVSTAQMSTPQQPAVASELGRGCAPLGAPYLRTTLYLGLSRRGGVVNKREWKAFLQNEVSPRFPAGLTVWEADGQWRNADGQIGRERAKVLLLVHKGDPDIQASIRAVVNAYTQAFEQESVLWETAPVCAAF